MESSHIGKSLQEMIMFQELLMFSNVQHMIKGRSDCVLSFFFFSQDSSPDPWTKQLSGLYRKYIQTTP